MFLDNKKRINIGEIYSLNEKIVQIPDSIKFRKIGLELHLNQIAIGSTYRALVPPWVRHFHPLQVLESAWISIIVKKKQIRWKLHSIKKKKYINFGARRILRPVSCTELNFVQGDGHGLGVD